MRPSLKYAPIIQKKKEYAEPARPSLKYEPIVEICGARAHAPHAGTSRQPHVMPRNSNPRRGNWFEAYPPRMTHAWRVAAATRRARTPSQPARHTRRRQAQFIGCLRPWDGYPAVPSPPRLPPDGASTSLPVYQYAAGSAHFTGQRQEGRRRARSHASEV